MLYRTYQPRSPLSQFIKFLWIREGDHLPETQSRLLPIGSMELVINLHEDRLPLFDPDSRTEQGSTNGTRLCGAHSQSFIINNNRQVCAIGVHFKPGGNAAFFSISAGELHNQIISLDQVWKSRATELRDRLLTASTSETRLLILEQFLLSMMQPSSCHPAVEFALRAFGQVPTPTVKTVIDQIGFSTRHFNQLFRDRVGLTPKLYCRVQRLQYVLHQLVDKEQVNWMDIAFTCGYFDQAHFIHDFRMFAHCTPTEYLAQRGFHPCHLVLPN
jgi:AraC-like DNA-binding protein